MAVQRDSSAKRGTLLAVILGSSAVFLESSIVAVALPSIGEELSSSLFDTLEAQSYVYYAYLLALSSLLILAGALNDYAGRRKMFVIGLVGFAVTSAACGAATSMEMLIASRILQGIAGAILVPGSLSIIRATFDGEEQGRAFGVWAGASGGMVVFAPLLGGILVAYSSWRFAFLLNVPVCAVALWLTVRNMGESRDEQASGRFDWSGAVVAALAVGGLAFGAIRGQAQGWDSTVPFVSLAVGLLALCAFPVMMVRSSDPLVPPDLFRSRNFTVTNISTLLIYGAIYVMVQFMALFLVGVLDYNEIGYGISGMPGPLLLALFSSRFGRLAARYGPRLFMALGPFLMGVGLLWFARIPSSSPPWRPELEDISTFVPPSAYVVDILPATILFGVGLMIMVAPLTTALMASVPLRHAGVGSAFNNAISRVGPQLAGALLFVIVSSTFYAALAPGGAHEVGADVRSRVSPLNAPPPDVDAAVEARVDEASTRGFHLAMAAAALLCFGGAAVNAAGIVNEKVVHEGGAAPAG